MGAIDIGLIIFVFSVFIIGVFGFIYYVKNEGDEL